MNFTKFLQKWFGLRGNLNRRQDKIDLDAEPGSGKGEFTKKGWEAWGRFIEMLDDMREIGLLPKDGSDYIVEKIWDIVFDD
jgi:hypothetical protein